MIQTANTAYRPQKVGDIFSNNLALSPAHKNITAIGNASNDAIAPKRAALSVIRRELVH